MSGLGSRFRVISMALLMAFVPDAIAQAVPSREYQIKAVFLFHFTEFVDWPATSFPQQSAPLVIGILGHDPFGAYLDEVVRGERVKNRALVIRRFQRAEDVQGCHVLYVGPAESGHAEFGAIVRSTGILTVGETDGFIRSGGIIRFSTDGGKLHLIINVAAAKAADLVISSKLLRTAVIVGSGRL